MSDFKTNTMEAEEMAAYWYKCAISSETLRQSMMKPNSYPQTAIRDLNASQSTMGTWDKAEKENPKSYPQTTISGLNASQSTMGTGDKAEKENYGESIEDSSVSVKPKSYTQMPVSDLDASQSTVITGNEAEIENYFQLKQTGTQSMKLSKANSSPTASNNLIASQSMRLRRNKTDCGNPKSYSQTAISDLNASQSMMSTGDNGKAKRANYSQLNQFGSQSMKVSKTKSPTASNNLKASKSIIVRGKETDSGNYGESIEDSSESVKPKSYPQTPISDLNASQNTVVTGNEAERENYARSVDYGSRSMKLPTAYTASASSNLSASKSMIVRGNKQNSDM